MVVATGLFLKLACFCFVLMSTGVVNTRTIRKGGPQLLILLHDVAGSAWWNPFRPASQSSTYCVGRRKRRRNSETMAAADTTPGPLNFPSNSHPSPSVHLVC
ncbi:hypothetical protein GE09DRAFT_506454 [Coniochaeta sp. 2T2.1]|nr:hypothetical protein GE09DRAFT_506454 [Coniochaeta sp. 2T2.1]